MVVGVTPGFTHGLEAFLMQFWYATAVRPWIFQNRKAPVSMSAYQMMKYCEGSGRKISYKNMLKKIHLLRDLGLIEKTKVRQEKAKYRHGAIFFQVSDAGLTHLLMMDLESLGPAEFTVILNQIDRLHVLQEILLPYFNKETILHVVEEEMTTPLPLAHALRSYIRECLEYITFYVSKMKSPGKQDSPLDEILTTYLETVAYAFVLKLYVFLHADVPVRSKDLEPVRKVFNADNKFSIILKSIRKKLDP